MEKPDTNNHNLNHIAEKLLVRYQERGGKPHAQTQHSDQQEQSLGAAVSAFGWSRGPQTWPHLHHLGSLENSIGPATPTPVKSESWGGGTPRIRRPAAVTRGGDLIPHSPADKRGFCFGLRRTLFTLASTVGDDRPYLTALPSEPPREESVKDRKKVDTQKQGAGGKSSANSRDLGTFTEDRKWVEAFMGVTQSRSHSKRCWGSICPAEDRRESTWARGIASPGSPARSVNGTHSTQVHHLPSGRKFLNELLEKKQGT